MTGELITPVEGSVGRIRLNRPKQLHALSHAMCDEMLHNLAAWEIDPSVEAIMIDHADGRGFCAGGDIKMLAASGASDGAAARAFFFTEYRLNNRLFSYAKPTIAFMDGVTMGGGVGISQPCDLRIATENTRFAMPETGIGLFPDVGGGWYLSRLPGRLGEYLALTGHRLNGADCAALGLATHYVPSTALEEAKAAICMAPKQVEETFARLSIKSPQAAIIEHRVAIDDLFGPDSLEGIFARLAATNTSFAQSTLAILRTKSPHSLKVSLKLLEKSRMLATFQEEMTLEYALASRIVLHSDFQEGVRAVILDKDNAPRWTAETPEGVSDIAIDEIFAPLASTDAWTPA